MKGGLPRKPGGTLVVLNGSPYDPYVVLVEELRILPVEMRMESFTGIKLEDLVGYAKSWHALSALEKFLEAEVHHRTPKEAMWCLVKKHDWKINLRSTVLVFHH